MRKRQRYVCLLLCLLLVYVSGCGSKKTAESRLDALMLDKEISRLSEIPETGNLRIAKLFYDETMPASRMMERAKTLFVEKYPGWTVSIEREIEPADRSSDTNWEAYQRYQNELPGRLRDDGGPDIVSLDNADTERLMREGLLEDLLVLIQSDDDFDLNRLLPGVLEARLYGNAVYGIPISFYTRVLRVQSSSIGQLSAETLTGPLPDPWTWTAMMDYFQPELEKQTQLKALIPYTPLGMLWTLMDDYYPYFYDYEAGAYDFTNPVFAEIMRTVKDLHERGMLWDINAEEYFHTQESGWMMLMAEMRGVARHYQNVTTFNGTDYPLPSIPGTKGMAISTPELYGISANASQKAAAWEFIKIMYSDDLQGSTDIWFQPVIAAFTNEDAKNMMGLMPFTDCTEEDIAAYNNERYAFFADIDRLSGSNGAPDVFGIVEKHADRYFRNEEVLETVLHDMQRETDEYLQNIR